MHFKLKAIFSVYDGFRLSLCFTFLHCYERGVALDPFMH